MTWHSMFLHGGVEFKVGDHVAVASESDRLFDIAKILAFGERNSTVKVQWFYYPDDIEGGRRAYQAQAEILESDHLDCIDGVCIDRHVRVLSLAEYQAWPHALLDDDVYLCRQQYHVATGVVSGSLPCFCRCQQPENPDRLMVECDACHNWFHPDCVQLPAMADYAGVAFRCQSCGGPCAPHPGATLRSTRSTARVLRQLSGLPTTQNSTRSSTTAAASLPLTAKEVRRDLENILHGKLPQLPWM